MKRMFIIAYILFMISALFAVIGAFSLRAIEGSILDQKLIELEREVDIIANDVRYEVLADNDWDTYNYNAKVASAVETIDAQNLTFACVYRGIAMDNISKRYPSYESSPFDPMIYPDFVDYVKLKFDVYGSHQYSIWLVPNDPELEPRTMYIRFRWVPLVESVDDPYLIVFAISEHTVETKVPLLAYFALFGGPVFVGVIGVVWFVTQHKRALAKEKSPYAQKYCGDNDNE